MKLKIYKTEYFCEIDHKCVDKIKKMYPSKEMMVCFGNIANLEDLEVDESVCVGDGKSFHFVLKPKAITRYEYDFSNRKFKS